MTNSTVSVPTLESLRSELTHEQVSEVKRMLESFGCTTEFLLAVREAERLLDAEAREAGCSSMGGETLAALDAALPAILAAELIQMNREEP